MVIKFIQQLILFDPNTTYEYKFLIGTSWDAPSIAEASNRSVDVGAANTVVDPVFFDNDNGQLTEIAISFQLIWN